MLLTFLVLVLPIFIFVAVAFFAMPLYAPSRGSLPTSPVVALPVHS